MAAVLPALPVLLLALLLADQVGWWAAAAVSIAAGAVAGLAVGLLTRGRQRDVGHDVPGHRT